MANEGLGPVEISLLKMLCHPGGDDCILGEGVDPICNVPHIEVKWHKVSSWMIICYQENLFMILLHGELTLENMRTLEDNPSVGIASFHGETVKRRC